LKTILIVTVLIATCLYSCNDNKVSKEKVILKDTTVNSLVLLTAKNTMTVLLCQNWNNKADVDDGVLNSSSTDDLELPFRSYSFFKDGSVVINPRDKIQFGKWKLDEATKHINIVLEDGSQKDIQIKDINVNNLNLKAANPEASLFVADGKTQGILSDEPLYISNNKWRIKPSHSEADSAIKNRVIQCVAFYSKFFKDNADHGYSAISFYGFPTCFKWYDGGISIINKDKVGQKWINCFYNKDQAIKGQQLLEQVILKKYNWNKAEKKWTKQSADVLLQVIDSLK